MRMVTEGLPVARRERGVHHDIIAGADFLSVLMDSPALRQAYRELSTTAMPTTTAHPTLQIPSNSLSEYMESNTPVIREHRSSRSTASVEPHTFTQLPNELGARTPPHVSDRTMLDKVNLTRQSSENGKSNASLIISVLVSSSEGDSRINKIPHDSKPIPEPRTLMEVTSEVTPFGEQTVVSSEEHPSIVAESSKSEFSVDEKEPITSDNGDDDYTQEYPANVQPLPSPQSSSPKDNLQPFGHHSVVYHDNPREPVRGRSVSYSAVIQTLPKQPEKKSWSPAPSNPDHKDRQERHYELKDAANENKFEKTDKKENEDVDNPQYPPSSSVAESNDYYITSKYETSSDYHGDAEHKETSWEKPEEAYVSSEASSKNKEPTEKNWEVSEKQHGQQEKPYGPTMSSPKHPVVYGKPEENYEVDEAVSVMTNGRAHGVQPVNKPQISTPTVEIRTDQSNDSQKVGYVVEGRNYRKYRVEERTSDGFIVGEYGVVNHDDGALRGVRYTADSSVNPRLIYNALMKFLSL